jgi:23S rRNA (cytosine1962-C5)-methyltransferase
MNQPQPQRKPWPGVKGRGKPKFLRDSPKKTSTGNPDWPTPWVQLRTYSFSSTLYPAMIAGASPDAKAGDLVHVYDREGRRFGTGLFNAHARTALRMIKHGDEDIGEDYFTMAIDRAISWRRDSLKLDAQTDAYRAINSDGDGLSGLIVDKFGDTLSIEVHSLGIYQRLPQWLPAMHEKLDTKREIVQVEERSALNEGIRHQPLAGHTVKIREHGVRYEVNFASGHKTGFFCDQRDNRHRFAQLSTGKRVLDLCCYTGGFAVSAAVVGGCADVTGVDLDEVSIAQARRNGNLNQKDRIRWVHADAFAYGRQMMHNNQTWGAVVLDPPKLVTSRDDQLEGRQKYEDLNRLAMSLVEPGGLFVTCSCSGLISLEDFEQLVIRAAHKQNRRLQFFDRTGPGLDHPVMSNNLEGRYLKALWTRVW